jgi:alpha-amylase/alpha-mannosidase (GH57 family)
MAKRLLCLHGHFYQPPRENPWIEAVEVQDSAEPFHDWNARIAAECYGPNGAARVRNAGGRIVDIVNNYLRLSFNFGPTLLAWLERHRPEAYRTVLEADARSLEQRGRGNALAQAYSHPILPLCSPRDLRTQIHWGIADFRRRFHRAPEGFWLPETAVDSATLAALAEAGIRFTVLSQYQARRVRSPGGAWVDADGGRFDPSRPYRVRAGDREIVVFFYDGQISRDIAFNDTLASVDALVRRLEGGFDAQRQHDEVVTVAFDGETLGHHRKGAEQVMAEALRRIDRSGGIRLASLSEALAAVPAEWEAEIAEASSWSCAHGVERWRSDCGCQTGGKPGWRQAWRAPLRAAIDGLRDRLAEIFEREAGPLLRDPWAARERFVEVVLDPQRQEAGAFLEREAGRRLDDAEEVKALRLLEMQRQSLLMYTSCGWFFSDVSGIETVQVLKYAARAAQLARDAAGVDLEPAFREALALAPSNAPEHGNGRRVYEATVEPSVVSLEGVGAHLAIAATARTTRDHGNVFCYRYRRSGWRHASFGPAVLALGRIELQSLLTGDRLDGLCCVLHFGASDFRCGLVEHPGEARHAEVEQRLFSRLDRLTVAQVLREIDQVFTGRDYTLRDLFLDERRRVAELLLADTLRRYRNLYAQIFEDNLRLMEFLREIDSPVPGPLRVAADVLLSRQIQEVTEAAARGELDLAAAGAQLSQAVETSRRLGAHLHLTPVRQHVEALIRDRLAALLAGRTPAARAAELEAILDMASRLGLSLELWDAQNRFWDWTGSGRVTLERDALARLARSLSFDEATVEERAGYAPRA